MKFSSEWDAQIQPLIDDVCLSVAAVMAGGAANLFREHSPVDLYTRIYEMTVRHRRDFSDIDYMHGRQVQCVSSFCDCFRADNLATLNRHLQGLGLLVRWFGCFFHHLNIFRQRIYGDSCPTSDEDMLTAVRANYIHPQEQQILSWLRGAWSVRRLDDDALESVRAIQRIDPSLHNTISTFYLSCLCDYYASLSLSLGDGIAYMTSVVGVFQAEEELFLAYFPGYDPVFARSALREVLVVPRQDKLVRAWARIVDEADVGGARVFTQFFSWSTCQDAWVRAHKDASAARVQSCTHVGLLDAFLRSQLRFLHDVFDRDKLRLVFVRVVEAVVRDAFTPTTTAQWVRETHRRLSACRPAAMLKLIGYCPDKDDLHTHYHKLLRTRLLTGSSNARHELAVLDVLEDAFGASFVLNMRLMMSEHNVGMSSPLCTVRRLSRVAWGFDCGGGGLKFQPPDAIYDELGLLHARWRKKTNPSICLELLPLEGSVVMTSGHVMSPTQAIVLMALPLARHDLADKLGVPDDDAHNITGILHSLERAKLVVRGDDDQWNHAPTMPPASLVPPPMPAYSFSSDGGQPQQTTAAIEAFIVRTLKKKQASGMTLAALCRLLASHRRVHEIVEGLVRREYLAWRGQDRLVYLP